MKLNQRKKPWRHLKDKPQKKQQHTDLPEQTKKEMKNNNKRMELLLTPLMKSGLITCQKECWKDISKLDHKHFLKLKMMKILKMLTLLTLTMNENHSFSNYLFHGSIFMFSKGSWLILFKKLILDKNLIKFFFWFID